MEEDIFYNNIQKALEDLPGNFNILEDKIDIAVQMKYFEFSRKLRKKNNLEEFFENREELFSPETDRKRKKEILAALAAYDDVQAYRTIENFAEEPDHDLHEWAVLALQESKMLMQSSLLDEQQVFISTGLGGKGQKLRYCVVFINKEREQMLTRTQQKLVKDELIFALKNEEGEFEVISFFEGFSTSLVLLPLKTDLKMLFRSVIDECNQYGNFLQEDMIVTNVKDLSRGEIIQLLNEKDDNNYEDLEEE
ncbi:MAG: hypothetical protein ACOC1J_00285 [Prolixibacteraceae bacterium]